MLMVLPLLFLGLSAISPLNTLQINPSLNSLKDVNSYSCSAPYTYKYLCCHPLLTKKNGNRKIVYVSAFLLTFTNNFPTLIAYKIQSDYTSNRAECFEIAGGIGVHGASHPTWSSQTTLKWPAVSNQAQVPLIPLRAGVLTLVQYQNMIHLIIKCPGVVHHKQAQL